MRRRAFITLIGGAAAWPLAARAQQPKVPVVGFLNNQSLAGRTYQVEAFRQGLGELGYVEGRNVEIEYRWAENQYERIPALAEDLVRLGVAVIAATGGAASVHAAKAATASIPIVFTAGSDPVEAGLVASLNRPGGNITGVSFLTDALGAKRVGLLREVMAQPGTIAVLMNPKGPDAERQSRELPSAAQAIGQSIEVPQRGCDRREYCRSVRRQGCSGGGARCIRDRHRPCPGRLGRQPEPTGRQLHGRDLHHE